MMFKFLLILPYFLVSSFAVDNLKNYNRGTELLQEGNPEATLAYFGEISLENRAPYLQNPLEINSRIALLEAAKKLEGKPLAGLYREIARKIGGSVSEFPEAFYLLQEKNTSVESSSPYKSRLFVLQAKIAAQKALLAVKLARAVKLLNISPTEVSEEILNFIEKSKEQAKLFLQEWKKDELAAYQARLCIESISSKVRPLIFDALYALEDAKSLLEKEKNRFLVPGTLIEEAIAHFEQVLKITEALPEEERPDDEKSAQQKVVEMELQDRAPKQMVPIKEEVERPW